MIKIKKLLFKMKLQHLSKISIQSIIIVLMMAQANSEVTPDPPAPPQTPEVAPVIIDEIKIPRKTYSKAFYAEINEIISVRQQLESQNKYLREAWDMDLDCRSSYWYYREGGLFQGHTSC